MSIQPRTFVALLALAFLFVGVSGCSDGGPASVRHANDEPSSEGGESPEHTGDTQATEGAELCAATATVGGASYHVVRVMSGDFGVNPREQVSGSASDCSGEGQYPMTFHAIEGVNPAMAICGLVDGRWHLFINDRSQVPADSALAKIVAGG